LAQQAAQDKINRELFVGNTPPGTSEMLLLQFFNAAMRRVKLCPPTASPVVQCRVSAKFAFVECATIQDANNCLNLSGIPFLGSSLKVSRPSKYNGPFVPSKTWQELTGQALPSGVVDPNEEKLNRELFIGNTTPEMTGEMLMDFLGKAMEQVGLTILPGNPINACRVNGKFAFIELRTVKETENALNLNNIPFMGAMLRVGRPSKYNGPLTKHGNWEDILAKYMSGELVLPNQSGGNSSTAATAAATTAQSAENVGFTSRVVELKNMLTLGDLENDEEYQDIMEDTKDECSQFGSLKSVIIPRSGPGATKIFLEYLTKEDAAKAITGLAGRTFDGRKVLAAFFSEDKFASKDYS
jgi:Transcriptional repressor